MIILERFRFGSLLAFGQSNTEVQRRLAVKRELTKEINITYFYHIKKHKLSGNLVRRLVFLTSQIHVD